MIYGSEGCKMLVRSQMRGVKPLQQGSHGQGVDERGRRLQLPSMSPVSHSAWCLVRGALSCESRVGLLKVRGTHELRECISISATERSESHCGAWLAPQRGNR